MNRVRDFPRFCRVRFWIESLWQIAADLTGSNFRLCIFPRASRIRPREFRVHAVDESELPVAADVVVVRVRIENHYRTRRQFCRNSADVADTHPRVEEHGLLVADNEIRNRFFRLMWLVDGEDTRRDFVDFKPRIVCKNALQ